MDLTNFISLVLFVGASYAVYRVIKWYDNRD